MFKRSFRSQDRVDKGTRLKKSTSVREPQRLSKKLQQSFDDGTLPHQRPSSNQLGGMKQPIAPSPIITLEVGREGRLFAAHEDVLSQSSYFDACLRGQFLEGKRMALPDEEPEVFSAVLEYLYKGDYYPRLLHDKVRNTWELEDAGVYKSSSPAVTPHLPTPSASPYLNDHDPSMTPRSTRSNGRGGRTERHLSANTTSTTPAASPGAGSVEATIYMPREGTTLLRDTTIYCAAGKYGLSELQKLALRKQGLQSGIDVGTILRSATYAYAHTPDSDSALRAHYLALIIRCRRTFKRSGTMQAEMERGGSKLFFDLFVAMCNHLDDVVEMGNSRSPRAI